MKVDEVGTPSHQGLRESGIVPTTMSPPFAPMRHSRRTLHARTSAQGQVLSEVARRTPDSLFLSAAWLQASLDAWDGMARYDVVEVAQEGRPPVWAVIGRRTEVRHGVLPVRVIALNQSGIPSLDQPWIERNGFYGGTPETFGRHLALLLERLELDPGWDELRLGGLLESHAHDALYLAARGGLACRLEFEQPSFNVDLRKVRTEHGGDYLAMLSANTRQQLRRARRHAESALGPLRLEQAASREDALKWFDASGPLHRRRWGGASDDPYSSGFDNPAFVAFHRRLIEIAFEGGGIQYLRLCAGDAVLAYLYNFVADTQVHFYLSGIDYGIDPSIKPGMLAHWYAIEHNLAAGMEVYDFLAGDARYKRSLSTGRDRTLWLVLQRPRWRLQLEGFARRMKRTLVGDAHDDLPVPHAPMPYPSGPHRTQDRRP